MRIKRLIIIRVAVTVQVTVKKKREDMLAMQRCCIEIAIRHVITLFQRKPNKL
jgi:hypothetical protein